MFLILVHIQTPALFVLALIYQYFVLLLNTFVTFQIKIPTFDFPIKN